MFTPIETERLILRRLRDTDLAAFLAYRNDPALARYQSWDTLDVPAARALIHAQQNLGPGTPGYWFYLGIELKGSGELIGDCGLQVLLRDVRQAQIGVGIARAQQGRGLATEAVVAVLDYAFIDLDLHRVVAVVDTESTHATHLFERAGMRREGHFVKNVWIKGRWADEYLYAVLQSEWLPRRMSR